MASKAQSAAAESLLKDQVAIGIPVALLVFLALAPKVCRLFGWQVPSQETYVSVLMAALAGLIGWVWWHFRQRMAAFSDDLGAAIDEVRSMKAGIIDEVHSLQAGTIEGKELKTIDDLYRTLCEARARCESRIRLMQVRAKPPVKMTADGRVQLDDNGQPILQKWSKFAEQWYTGLADWVSQDGHQGERATLGERDSLAYAKFVNVQMAAQGASTWTTYVLHQAPVGLPVYNLCIFDHDEVTITYKVAYGSSGHSLWFRDRRVAEFFVRVFEEIITSQFSYHSIRNGQHAYDSRRSASPSSPSSPIKADAAGSGT